MALMSDIIKEAIKTIECVQKVVEKTGGEDFGSSFRARAREFPELMESIGLLPALTFMYAKATNEKYKDLCRFIDEPAREEGLKLSKEEFGYGMYLYAILSYLEKMAITNGHIEPIEVFKQLCTGETMLLAKSILKSYLIEIKKLSEAVFKAKRVSSIGSSI